MKHSECKEGVKYKLVANTNSNETCLDGETKIIRGERVYTVFENGNEQQTGVKGMSLYSRYDWVPVESERVIEIILDSTGNVVNCPKDVVVKIKRLVPITEIKIGQKFRFETKEYTVLYHKSTDYRIQVFNSEYKLETFMRGTQVEPL